MTCFTDLPGELRNKIYDDVLQSVFSQSASPPWRNLQTPDLFLCLLLCNKQVHNEIKSRFNEDYANNLTVCCDNIADLVQYHDECASRPVLQNANFIVHDIRLGGTRPSGDHWMIQLLKTQPGFKYWWLERTRLYRAKPIYRRMFEEREFSYSEVEHVTGRLEGVGTCVGYKKLVYPTLKNGCKITSYAWITQGDEGYVFETGSMVLEGKLKDLFMDATVREYVQIT